MLPVIPETQDLLLIGGGHAHAILLRMWGMKPLPGARLTLINPQPTAPYTGMLPGYVAGHYAREALDIDLVKLARFAGARLIMDKVGGLDPAAGIAELENRPPVSFDIASIDIGITSEANHPESLSIHSVAAKPLGPFASKWQDFAERARSEMDAPRAVMIGGGVGGCELALAMAHRLGKGAHLTLIEQGPEILPAENKTLRGRLLAALQSARIELVCGQSIQAASEGQITLESGRIIEADFIAAATGAHPFSWLQHTGLELSNGFITISKTLQSVSHPNIFAVGDCAHMAFAPRPKAGVYAVRQGPVLYDNLCAALTNEPLRPYHPQKDYLKLISLGDKRAMGSKWGITLSGRSLWQRKDKIDTDFMHRLTDLPIMQPQNPPPIAAIGVAEEMAGEPLCGGCGAKLAQDILSDMLASLASGTNSTLLTGPGDDASVHQLSDGSFQVMSVDQLRAFTLDPYRFARICAVHALGDIWAMGASPQQALIALMLPPLSTALARRSLEEIMTGLKDVMEEAGAEIGGGHTSHGAELSLAITVTGQCASRPLGLKGAKPGDALVLTKPIGTGVLLAGEMRKLAKGADIAALYQCMQRLGRQEASALGAHAHAMTDVTGFGLAGHLLNILRASGVGAEINLKTVPLLSGAEAMARAGVRSSLWQGNVNAVSEEISAIEAIRKTPVYDLLFDPQTAGGLLAAMPAEIAAEMPGVIIGYVTGDAGLSVL